MHLLKLQFAIDTALFFGFTFLAGIYGNVASARADIMCFISIGSILYWVEITTCSFAYLVSILHNTAEYIVQPHSVLQVMAALPYKIGTFTSEAAHSQMAHQKSLIKIVHFLCAIS